MTRPLDNMFDELSGPSMPLGPTDWPEPASLRRRAEHRRTVRRASIASGLAVIAAVAIAVPATLASQHGGTNAPADHDSPTATAKAVPAPNHPKSPAARSTTGNPVAAGIAVPTGTLVDFGRFSLVSPTGWSAVPSTDGAAVGATGAFHSVCFLPPGTRNGPSLYGCAGLAMYYDGFLPGAGTAPFNDPAGRQGVPAWAHGTGTPTCPAAGNTAGAAAVTPLSGPVQQDWTFPGVGNAHATYNVWHVSCSDGTSFSPQAWYLPVSGAVFFLYSANPAAEALLATFQKH